MVLSNIIVKLPICQCIANCQVSLVTFRDYHYSIGGGASASTATISWLLTTLPSFCAGAGMLQERCMRSGQSRRGRRMGPRCFVRPATSYASWPACRDSMPQKCGGAMRSSPCGMTSLISKRASLSRQHAAKVRGRDAFIPLWDD